MRCKASSALKLLALAATVTLISSASIAHAATLTTGTGPGPFVPIGTTNAIITGNTVSVPSFETFTDLSFTVTGSVSPVGLTSGTLNVTGTGSDGMSAMASMSVGGLITGSPVSQPFTFTSTNGTTPLSSVAIATSSGGSGFLGGTPTGTVSFSGISGLEVVPLPATFPLFATGLGALGLMGWRRKRKSSTSALAA